MDFALYFKQFLFPRTEGFSPLSVYIARQILDLTFVLSFHQGAPRDGHTDEAQGSCDLLKRTVLNGSAQRRGDQVRGISRQIVPRVGLVFGLWVAYHPRGVFWTGPRIREGRRARGWDPAESA